MSPQHQNANWSQINPSDVIPEAEMVPLAVLREHRPALVGDDYGMWEFLCSCGWNEQVTQSGQEHEKQRTAILDDWLRHLSEVSEAGIDPGG